VLVAQPGTTLDGIIEQAERFGIAVLAGDPAGVVVEGVQVLAAHDLEAAARNHLVIAAQPGGAPPLRAYQLDIAIRRCIAAEVAGVVLPSPVALAETARALADRAGLTVLAADGPPSELAVFVDRCLRRGAAEALARAEQAIETVCAVADTHPSDVRTALLDAAGSALGVRLSLQDDPGVRWTDPDAVCIGEVPIGRLVAERRDPAAAIALPVVAAVLSRASARESQDRFGPVRSRADLVIELLVAESSRIDALAIDAARAGLPVQLSHSVAWVSPRHHDDGERHPSPAQLAALELRALQLVDERSAARRDETWHVVAFHDDLLMIVSEEPGAPDHQRRLREVVDRFVELGTAAIGPVWAFTVGLGTPQSGAPGLRQSATEARIAAESAVAGGRLGSVVVTDVTGLRRVLLDFSASPLSRTLLDDVLAPLDALGPERSLAAVRTLLAYLSTRNSLARAATVLNLHPNAVNYRIRRIEQTLALDLDDPDTRFAVELACRLRLVTGAR
jgi:sugar diacid utilization regulator